jgi:hypothetical protein
MCGWTSGLTLLNLAEGDNNLEIKLVDYSNSGDSPNAGKDEVVGYNAIVMIDKKQNEATAQGAENSFHSLKKKKNNFLILPEAVSNQG